MALALQGTVLINSEARVPRPSSLAVSTFHTGVKQSPAGGSREGRKSRMRSLRTVQASTQLGEGRQLLGYTKTAVPYPILSLYIVVCISRFDSLAAVITEQLRIFPVDVHGNAVPLLPGRIDLYREPCTRQHRSAEKLAALSMLFPGAWTLLHGFMKWQTSHRCVLASGTVQRAPTQQEVGEPSSPAVRRLAAVVTDIEALLQTFTLDAQCLQATALDLIVDA